MLAPERTARRRAVVEPLLSIRGLVADYGSRRALHGVDLDIRPGEVVALAGENGAGKSTVVRCIAGDLSPTAGELRLDQERIRPSAGAVARRGVAVVWQDLSLCDNLDVASNLLLGREGRFLRSEAKFHHAAAALLKSLDIPISDTTQAVSTLSGGQRQLIAVARAMRDRPRLLILDEPTASLGVFEAAQVEGLTRRLCEEGTTILVVSHDIDQMFRLADRITVLRQGRVVADVDTATGHPDEVVALMSGQAVDSSPRRQLDRLHSLVGRLTSVDAASSLAVILSALGTALAADRLCIHLLADERLTLTASVGLAAELTDAWRELPVGPTGGPPGTAAARGAEVVDPEVRSSRSWATFAEVAERADIRSSWSVPVTGSSGLLGVITVFRTMRGAPHRDELDLVKLYAGYAASAAERDALLGDLTARNRILETIRIVLEELARSVRLADGLDVAIDTLRLGLGASEVGLLGWSDDDGPRVRGWSGSAGETMATDSAITRALPGALAADGGVPVTEIAVSGSRVVAAQVPAPEGALTLLAAWPVDAVVGPDADAYALLEDAARSLQLALEREGSEQAHREAAALRRSQELQLDFLSRLSHELRTPLTAIHGYADSLLQPDVKWDEDSQTRFLSRITSESARLSRLVGDLLDLSAVDSNVLRLQRDWCDVALIMDAARACLPMPAIERISLEAEGIPVVLADHDRLEQVLVNLMDNAIRHNPPATHVTVRAWQPDTHWVTITVSDDGVGLPPDVETTERPAEHAAGPRSLTAGAGLGLSISRAIIAAHGGRLRLRRLPRGTRWQIDLPLGGDTESSEHGAVEADG
jgi:ABC-type multidrug transport system ATPase subunit/nitrogen-specific signal transduction histidine kinase